MIAAFQGLVGFRPDSGRRALAPEMDPMELGLVSVGPMARDVADAQALFSTLAGRALQTSAHNLPETSLAGLKIGWLGNAGGHWPIEPSILRYCEQALEALAALPEPRLTRAPPTRLPSFGRVGWRSVKPLCHRKSTVSGPK